ncbi:MAG: hypothetical protein ACSLFP_11750 [Acidimicrobiales bacterium]
MGSDESIEQGELGPGLHVFEETYPLKRAGHLAARLGADLCATLPQVVAAIEARAGLPAVDAEALEELRSLAARLDRARSIVAATHARAVDDVAGRLTPTGAAVAVHPSTIRDRAAVVEAARAVLAEAEQALTSHAATRAERGEQADRAAAAGAEVAPHPESVAVIDPAEPARPATPTSVRRTRAIGVIVIAGGAGLVLVALELAPLWAALIPLLLACLWAMRYLQPPEVDADVAATTSLLREVASATDDAFGTRRASARDGTGALLSARRDQAQEQVRVAERHWHDLAGADADVAAVDDVVRRFDPQHQEAQEVAAGTVSVRAATTLVARLTERWQLAWESRGGTAPEPVEAQAAVARLEALAVRPVVLVGPAVDRAEDLVMAAPGAPVIVLDGPID